MTRRLSEQIRTPRLLLRRPRANDAEAVFTGWASDPVATRHLSWPRHTSVADALAFIHWSDEEWSPWPGGPLIVESLETGTLLGCSGLTFETDGRAEIGYVFSQQAWGQGYATETVLAVLEAARPLAPLDLFAGVHPDNTASTRVLEKCGFTSEGTLREHARFPNLDPDRLLDVSMYSYMVDLVRGLDHRSR
ncbi:MAG: GNAT family N-acetyltransferase [Thermoleophilia bacterium]|nr:GNAT family N-acetyltransferase [Thermoleophilia bacterium]